MPQRSTDPTTARTSSSMRWIGLLPAAGQGTRLMTHLIQRSGGANPGSKEILLIPNLHTDGWPDAPGPQASRIPVCEYLLRQYVKAGIHDIALVRRESKHDIHDCLTQPRYGKLTLHDIVTPATPSTVHTLDKAFALSQHAMVALGFPDILLTPYDLFAQLKRFHLQGQQAISVAAMQATDPYKFDMIKLDQDRVCDIAIKPGPGDRSLTWVAAVWRPAFTHYLHRFVEQLSTRTGDSTNTRETYVGDAIQSAINAGFDVRALTFTEASALDIGTPADFERALALCN